jgi:hypothetical protein
VPAINRGKKPLVSTAVRRGENRHSRSVFFHHPHKAILVSLCLPLRPPMVNCEAPGVRGSFSFLFTVTTWASRGMSACGLLGPIRLFRPSGAAQPEAQEQGLPAILQRQVVRFHPCDGVPGQQSVAPCDANQYPQDGTRHPPRCQRYRAVRPR